MYCQSMTYYFSENKQVARSEASARFLVTFVGHGNQQTGKVHLQPSRLPCTNFRDVQAKLCTIRFRQTFCGRKMGDRRARVRKLPRAGVSHSWFETCCFSFWHALSSQSIRLLHDIDGRSRQAIFRLFAGLELSYFFTDPFVQSVSIVVSGFFWPLQIWLVQQEVEDDAL